MELNEYWFKPKKYGYGAYPITFEGWLLLLLFIICFIFFIQLHFYFSAFGCVLFLVFFSKLKTKGEWKWRWG
jgi:hypothetical protein